MRNFWSLFVILFVVDGFDCGITSSLLPRRRPLLREERQTSSQPLTTTELPETSTVQQRMSRLSLPSNATSIRSDISDNFSCNEKAYGYYADIDNDCQVFHVCLPVTYPDGKEQRFRWSFICPEETTFNQEVFTCVRTDEMPFSCDESEKFYELNRYLGISEELAEEQIAGNDLETDASHNERQSDRKHDKMKENNNQNGRPSRTTLATTTSTAPEPTTTTTTTTATPITTTRRKKPHSRRTTASTSKRTNAPSTEAVTPTSTTTRLPHVDETTVEIHKKEVQFPTTTSRALDEESATTTETAIDLQFDSLFGLGNAHAIGETTPVPFEEAVATVRVSTNDRIVPDLLESSNNGPIIDSPPTNAAAEVVNNIKQLQSLFATTNGLEDATTIAGDDQRDKRILFQTQTPDTIENRRKLFQQLNSKNFFE